MEAGASMPRNGSKIEVEAVGAKGREGAGVEGGQGAREDAEVDVLDVDLAKAAWDAANDAADCARRTRGRGSPDVSDPAAPPSLAPSPAGVAPTDVVVDVISALTHVTLFGLECLGFRLSL